MLERHCRGGVRILDLGCGTATLLSEIDARGRSLVGLDLLAEGLIGARRQPSRLLLVQADARRLPVRGGSFDAVTCIDVLEHVDESQLLGEARDALRPGGVAIFTVPAAPWLWSARDERAGHLRRYTRRSLCAALEAAGFSVLETRYYQFLLFPVFVLTRLLGRRASRPIDLEEAPAKPLNAVLGAINRAEVRLSSWICWPWGSSLVAAGRRA
jgi:SAM-dependent methyltransferase